MEDNELSQAYERKKRLLQEKGNLTKKKLDDVWHERSAGRYIGDIVFGANDGIITTFAVISGATGGALAPTIIIILGVANLFADGVSMGLGNFLGTRSEHDYAKGQREKEMWEIEHLPEIEQQEIREIFSKWGFTGNDLERAVTIISQNKEAWVDIMMKYELEIFESESKEAGRKGLATFISFIIAGAVPLLPFLLQIPNAFNIAIGITAIELFTIGALRTKVSPMHWLRAGLEMLIVGALAAVIAFMLGKIIQAIV